ncbi:hypothetical protein M0R45_032778 [Rubus argutus]|uniref:DNA-directed RNA polymerase III subunit RPC6 n=1 Tax=Rubus argutus TaxID=59490 RepID=A0AAW1WKH2_RUBAR
MNESSQGPSALKRKRQDSNSQSDSSLTEHERKLYDAIRSKEDMGMSKQVLKRETNLTMVVINKTLKTLEGKKKCVMIINKNEGASLKEILAAVESKKLLQVKLTPKDMKEILEALVLDNEIMKAGEDCYKCCKKGTRGEPNLASMASIPCGVCPRINQCTPDGIISPNTCEYFKKWLEF